MNRKIKFAVENAEIIDEDPTSQFATAKILAFSTGVSKHNTTCTLEDLKRTSATIYEKPIIFEYSGTFRDFGTHSEHPIISGFVVPNTAEFIERDDGRFSLSVLAKIWKRYAPQFIQVFQESGTSKRSVSVELEILDSVEENGLIKMLDWVYSAVCVLGEMVTPASPGAEIEMLSFAEKENEEYKNLYNLEFSSKYDSLDFKIPSSVKKNAQEGLDLREKFGRGGTSVGLASARYLIKNNVASPEKIRHIAKYFPRHAGDNLNDKESNGWIAWQLWGGNASRKWSTALVKQMDEIDNRQMSYFEKGGNEMPYTSMKDVNPSVKGIDPPVSLSQANEIAKAADAIGTDEDKKGWAIAISNFKKNHEVKDGKWVKKEKMSEEEFAKDDLGKGEAIEVDKSKESMVSGSWGNVDKTALRNKVLNASNYKSLVKDVYLLVEDGYEDHPSSSLKYPVMQISGGKLVYNRYGLGAALQRASGQNETEVVSKVHAIYKKLGIDGDQEKESFAAFANFEEKEEDDLNMAEKDKEKEETPEEEKKESPEEEKQEKEEGDEKKFSLASYVDVPATMAFLEQETEEAGEMADKIRMGAEEMKKGDEADFGVVMGAMYAKMCKMAEKIAKMAEDNKVYLAENEDLKKRLADQEEQQKAMAVDTFMKEMAEMADISEDQMSELRKKSEEFSYDNLEQWKNYVKAFSFDLKKTDESKTDKIIRYANSNFYPHTKVDNKNPWKLAN